MYNILNLFTNYPLVSAISAWLIAQIFKIFTGFFSERKFDFVTFLTGCGGMPSSHASAVTALFVACVIQYGFASFEVAVTGVLAVIVMRDASGVRRETGKQAKVINRIIKEMFDGKAEDFNENLKELIGHSPLQVFFGALLGIAVPFIFKGILL